VKTALIVGASRGLGLEFVRQYLADGWQVYATARRAINVTNLDAMGAKTLKLDVTSPKDLLTLKDFLQRKKLDVAIYNAGVYGPNSPRVDSISRADFDGVMRANVWGAMLCVPVVAPAVSRAQGKLVFISSTMGSITQMDGHNRVTYRASKSALNVVAKASALEWGGRGVTCVSMHPGWVRTDMGGPNADIDVDVSVSGMRKAICSLTDASSGCFLNYRGEPETW
jgi:NAD(P)-dependent dehydrogenase (short-subunit alcohol dehydrogenase family)